MTSDTRLQDNLERLQATLDRLHPVRMWPNENGKPSRCEIIYGGRPAGFMCLDQEADYRANPARYGDPLAGQLARGETRCAGCQTEIALRATA